MALARADGRTLLRIIPELSEGNFQIDVLARYRVPALNHLLLGECKTSEIRDVPSVTKLHRASRLRA
jgi:hypothetical protein